VELARNFGSDNRTSELQERLLEKIVVIVPQMYRMLFEAMGDGLEDVRRATLGQSWVWVGDRFVSTSQLCFQTPVDARPYMHQLPYELTGSLGELFRRLGVRTSCMPLDFAEMLADMARESAGQPLQQHALNVSIAVIIYLSDRASELHASCYVPSDKGVLTLSPHLVFDDAPWLSGSEQFRKKHQFAHPKLSNDVAEKMGIKSLRSFLIGSTSQSLGLKIDNAEAFGQTESLTRRLRNVLALYPEGPGVLFEMMQNADDACASEVKIMLNTTDYGSSSLLSPKMAEWQGPALYVYNDAVFSDEDFVNLSQIGQGSKLDKMAATGRFGLGFNAVALFPLLVTSLTPSCFHPILHLLVSRFTILRTSQVSSAGSTSSCSIRMQNTSRASPPSSRVSRSLFCSRTRTFARSSLTSLPLTNSTDVI
jgi:sacsin